MSKVSAGDAGLAGLIATQGVAFLLIRSLRRVPCTSVYPAHYWLEMRRHPSSSRRVPDRLRGQEMPPSPSRTDCTKVGIGHRPIASDRILLFCKQQLSQTPSHSPPPTCIHNLVCLKSYHSRLNPRTTLNVAQKMYDSGNRASRVRSQQGNTRKSYLTAGLLNFASCFPSVSSKELHVLREAS